MSSGTVVTILAWCLGSGCAAAEEGGLTRRALCTTECAKSEMCWSEDIDEAECFRDCLQDTHLSQVGMEARLACTTDLTCSELEDLEEWDRCLLRQMGVAGPTPIGAETCEAWAQFCKACYGDACDEGAERRDCGSDAAFFADDFLAELAVCYAGATCDGIGDCLADVRARYGTAR